MRNLSQNQIKAFDKMAEGGWHCAYSLQTSMATLNALVNRGLIIRRTPVGSLFFPRTEVMYHIAKERP